MNKGWMQRVLPHFIAIVVFLIVAVIYCKPVLDGQVLVQDDVTQWKAMAQNSFDYKEKHGHFPLWTNGMFSGMPAYHIAMEPDVIANPSFLYGPWTLFLPKPISFFFLACVCFYLLTQVIRVNPYLGIFGALAYAYATYNPIIVAAGHDTKMWSIALMPGLIAGVMLIYERRYLWGAALTAMFTSLMVGMNHTQIVYYTLMILFALTIAYAIRWVRARDFKHLLLAGGIALGSGLVGVMSVAVQILTTLEAGRTTIRGGTELPDANANKEGLSENYAFDYSMSKPEPLVMMVPNLYGGSSREGLIDREGSKVLQQLQAIGTVDQNLPNSMVNLTAAYWGGIGSADGPPYVGAIICFLTLLGFFLLDNRHKWWVLGLSLLTILMSWGGYFKGFNSVLLDTLPFYNKFRAPSMIIVIPTFLFCFMAVLTLQKIITAEKTASLLKDYRKGLLLTGGVFLLILGVYFTADFLSPAQGTVIGNINKAYPRAQLQVNGFVDAVVNERKEIFMASLGRSFLFIALAAFLLWLAVRNKLSAMIAMVSVGVLAFIDVMAINPNYLSEDNYVDDFQYQSEFQPSAADATIMSDKNGFFRVFDMRQGVSGSFNGGANPGALFHKLIGGYHPAKLSIYQDLIKTYFTPENGRGEQLYPFLAQNPGGFPIVNMLNTRYLIFPLPNNSDTALLNPNASGPAWFVNAVGTRNTPREVMDALGTLPFRDSAIVFAQDRAAAVTGAPSTGDTIALLENDNDLVRYQYSSGNNRFAVFSEVFYRDGWKAYVDGKELPIIRTNYLLRGLSLPAGQNKEIRFEFKPDAYYNGLVYANIGSVAIWLLLVSAIGLAVWKFIKKKDGSSKQEVNKA